MRSVPIRNYRIADTSVFCYRLGEAMYGPGTRYACYNADTLHPITTIIKEGSRWITSVFPEDKSRTLRGALERYVGRGNEKAKTTPAGADAR